MYGKIIYTDVTAHVKSYSKSVTVTSFAAYLSFGSILMSLAAVTSVQTVCINSVIRQVKPPDVPLCAKKLLNLAEESRIWTLADSSDNGRSECRKYARGAPKRTRGHPRKVLMTKASSILPLAGDLKTLGLFLSL